MNAEMKRHLTNAIDAMQGVIGCDYDCQPTADGQLRYLDYAIGQLQQAYAQVAAEQALMKASAT